MTEQTLTLNTNNASFTHSFTILTKFQVTGCNNFQKNIHHFHILPYKSGYLEKQVKFSYVNDLGPRSRNVLDLQYSDIIINSISFRSQAAIVSEKSTFSLFPTEKPKLQNLTLP